MAATPLADSTRSFMAVGDCIVTECFGRSTSVTGEAFITVTAFGESGSILDSVSNARLFPATKHYRSRHQRRSLRFLNPGFA